MALIRKLVTVAAVFILAGFQGAGLALADENSRGRALFDLCAQCHGSAGQGMS